MKKLFVLLILIGVGYLSYQQFFKSEQSGLDPLYEMPYIVVYGKTSCSWTKKCLEELRAEGIDVIFENIDQNDVKMEIFPRVDKAGHQRNKIVIPIVDVNAHILVGYEKEKVLELYRQYNNEST